MTVHQSVPSGATTAPLHAPQPTPTDPADLEVVTVHRPRGRPGRQAVTSGQVDLFGNVVEVVAPDRSTRSPWSEPAAEVLTEDDDIEVVAEAAAELVASDLDAELATMTPEADGHLFARMTRSLIAAAAELSHAEYRALTIHTATMAPSGDHHQPLEVLADRYGMRRETLSRATAALVDAGWLTRQDRGWERPGKRRPFGYQPTAKLTDPLTRTPVTSRHGGNTDPEQTVAPVTSRHAGTPVTSRHASLDREIPTNYLASSSCEQIEQSDQAPDLEVTAGNDQPPAPETLPSRPVTPSPLTEPASDAPPSPRPRPAIDKTDRYTAADATCQRCAGSVLLSMDGTPNPLCRSCYYQSLKDRPLCPQCNVNPLQEWDGNVNPLCLQCYTTAKAAMLDREATAASYRTGARALASPTSMQSGALSPPGEGYWTTSEGGVRKWHRTDLETPRRTADPLPTAADGPHYATADETAAALEDDTPPCHGCGRAGRHTAWCLEADQ